MSRIVLIATENLERLKQVPGLKILCELPPGLKVSLDQALVGDPMNCDQSTDEDSMSCDSPLPMLPTFLPPIMAVNTPTVPITVVSPLPAPITVVSPQPALVKPAPKPSYSKTMRTSQRVDGTNRYNPIIRVNKTQYSLGTYNTIEEADRVFDYAVSNLHQFGPECIHQIRANLKMNARK